MSECQSMSEGRSTKSTVPSSKWHGNSNSVAKFNFFTGWYQIQFILLNVYQFAIYHDVNLMASFSIN